MMILIIIYIALGRKNAFFAPAAAAYFFIEHSMTSSVFLFSFFVAFFIVFAKGKKRKIPLDAFNFVR